MTIHHEHPFADPPQARDALRRFRGRLPAPVTIVATRSGDERVGLTVSSVLVVTGEPGHVVAMIDPDSGLGTSLTVGSTLTVSVLGPDDRYLAEAFAGLAPAPGGVFTLGRWTQTPWGPVREDAGWVGAVVTDLHGLGWSLQVTATVERVVPPDGAVLIHQRGRYSS